MKYLIANWKAQMTLPQIQDWVTTFKELIHADQTIKEKLVAQEITIIIAPPSPFLIYLQYHFKDESGIAIATQNISTYEEGKYTGEVTAKALQNIAEYAVIGHSERRQYFNETEHDIQTKIELCKKYGIRPILCVRNNEDKQYSGIHILSYEPVGSIGTGQNATIEDVLEMKNKLNISSDVVFLYGGSADENNAKQYLETQEVEGFLVGTASLDAQRFFKMAQQL